MLRLYSLVQNEYTRICYPDIHQANQVGITGAEESPLTELTSSVLDSFSLGDELHLSYYTWTPHPIHFAVRKTTEDTISTADITDSGPIKGSATERLAFCTVFSNDVDGYQFNV